MGCFRDYKEQDKGDERSYGMVREGKVCLGMQRKQRKGCGM